MWTPRIGLVSVAAACVIAAGTGAFVATRQLNTPTPAPAEVPSPAPSPAPQPVQETEAVLEEGMTSQEEPKAPEKAPPSAQEPPARPRQAPQPPERARRAPRTATASAASRPAPRPQPPAPAAPAARTPEPPRAETPVETRAPQADEPLTVPELPTSVENVPPRMPQRELQELVVEADSVVGLQLENTVSSETAQVEDRVSARVSRDVTVDGRVAVPAGSRMLGAVTVVERGGKMKERARLGVRFHTLVLADGTNLPIQTETIYRDGESPAGGTAAKVGGGAIAGAIIGGILGGARGAVIGGSTGAAGGTAAVMAGSRRAATIASGSSMTVRVLSPVTVTVEQ